MIVLDLALFAYGGNSADGFVSVSWEEKNELYYLIMANVADAC